MQAFSAQERHHATRGNGFCRVHDTLKEEYGDPLVSRQKLRQAEGVTLIRERRESGNQILGFATRPFIFVRARRPAAASVGFGLRATKWFFTLQITGHPDFGLAFGQDRLVQFFLSILAVRQQSQTIRFKSAAQMLDTFGMAKGGKEYRRLVAAFDGSSAPPFSSARTPFGVALVSYTGAGSNS